MADQDKPDFEDETPFVSDSQFELDVDNYHTSPWPKIMFGIVVAVGIVLGVMYVKNIGPFHVDEPKPVEAPPPAPVPAPVALPPPPPPPVVPAVNPAPPPEKPAPPPKKAAKTKTKAKKHKKHH